MLKTPGYTRWIPRVLLALVAPLLVVVILEGGLALTGQGRETAYFIPLSDDGRLYANPDFGITFFGRDLNRHPGEIAVARGKPAGVFRIVVLGGSAAFGTPDTGFSFARVLEAMLAQRFPATRFEVINTGMVAINSHVVRQIARECRALDPDFTIVYMGNNEVVGPYGPGTALLNFQPSLRFIRTQVALRKTRTVQWLHTLSQREPPREWQGMNMFLENTVSATDPRLGSVYANFEANLRDICRVAAGESSPVILSTLLTNLDDLPPFASAHREGLSDADRSRWETLFREGVALQDEGQFEEAHRVFREAEAIDDQYAELHYRAGRCLAALKDEGAARERFVRARNLDALRFRADSRIQDIIRETAADPAARDVHLVDAEALTAERADSELLYEHVHLTFEGNYALAAALYPQIVERLPDALRSEVKPGSPPPSLNACADWLAYTPFARFKGREKINELTARPPFPETRRAEDQAALRACREALDPAAMAALTERVQARVRERGEDVHLRIALGRLQMHQGDFEGAAESFERGLALYPPGANLRFLLGKAMLSGGRAAEAERELRRVYERIPHNAQVLQTLGQARHQQGDSREALALFKQALALNPQNPGLLVSMGRIHLTARRPAEAAEHYRAAIELDPGWAEAHAELGVCMALLNNHEAAVKSLRQASRLAPGSADIHYQLATAYVRVSRPDTARAHFTKAVALDPAYRHRPIPELATAKAEP